MKIRILLILLILVICGCSVPNQYALKDTSFLNNLINELNIKLNLMPGQLSIEKVQTEETEECQEPDCRHPASDDWGGLKVCRDHYEKYKQRHDDRILSMDDY